MRTIRSTARFKKDDRREARGHYGATLDQDLAAVPGLLSEDKSLPPRLRDHALSGDWKDHRDCHIKPDLVMIYRLPDGKAWNCSGRVLIVNSACERWFA